MGFADPSPRWRQWHFLICLIIVGRIKILLAEEECRTCDYPCELNGNKMCHCIRIKFPDYLDTEGITTNIGVECHFLEEPYTTLNNDTCPENGCLYIIFHNSNITTIPINFFIHTPHVQTIHLIKSRVRNLGIGSFAGLSSISYLNLQYNEIEILKTGYFQNISTLNKLNLHDNLIKSVEAGAFLGLTSLEELDLGSNKITAIPKDLLLTLNNLKKLILSENLLTSTDFKVNKINTLFLDHNKITDLPECYTNSNIDYLSLESNQIGYVDISCFPQKLQSLNIADNKISDLTYLDHLNSLKFLNASRNNLGKLFMDTFEITRDLISLDLSQNNVSHLEIGIFSKATQIKYLYLGKTNLKNLDSRVIIPLSKLSVLDINGNHMNNLDLGFFDHFNNFEKISLHGNNFNCDVVSELLLLAEKRKFSLQYETDYSTENIKGFPCNSSNGKMDSMENLKKQLTNLGTHLISELRRLEDLEQTNFEKIESSIKSEQRELLDFIRYNFNQLEKTMNGRN